MSEFFTVMAIDPRTRAPATPPVEGFASADALRALMVRTPAIDRPELLSWGDVTRVELEALAQAGHLELDDDVQAPPSEQPICSIFSARR
jgi:hypothetical protein